MNETPITGGEFPGRKERRLKMAEAIKVIKLLWEQERVDFEGEYYKLRRATIYDRPDEPVPIYVAASGPLAAKLAGRVGDGFICTSGKDPQLYVDLLANVKEGAEKAGRDYESIKRMIEVKVSYDRDPERAEKATHWWAALALTPEEKEGVEDPVEMERLADAAHRPRAHALHRLRRPAGGRGQDPALHRPRLHRAGLPLPRQRPEALHRRVRHRRLPAPEMTFEILDERFAPLVKTTAKLDHLYDGCRWAEGPAYFPAHRALVWSDIPNDRMLRYDEATGQRRRVPRARAATRTATPSTGRAGWSAASTATAASPAPSTTARSPCSPTSYEGKRLNSPNDVVVRSDGTVYFTRPGLRHRGLVRGLRGRSRSTAAATSSGSTRSRARSASSPTTSTTRTGSRSASTSGCSTSPTPATEAHARVRRRRRRRADRPQEFAKCTNGGFDGFRLDEDGRIWTSAGDGVHVYDPDGTLIGKVLVPETVANVAWGWPKRNRLYICATTSLYAILLPVRRSEDDVAMIDLHVHFPMRLLGGVEAPRDVIEGMTRVRGREDGKLRAAVLAIAARLFNFRDWDGTWRVTPQLLEQGDVTIACSVLYRPFSEMDLDEPYGAPPESAYYPKLIELLEATEREVARTGGVDGAHARRTSTGARISASCTASRAASTSARRRRRSTAHVRELADRGVLYITLAHLFWRRSRPTRRRCPFLPDAVYNLVFPQAKGAALSELGEAAVRGDVRAQACSSTSATCATTRSTRRSR